MKRHSFERFYMEKIALGEGCGCAEHVTRIRDLDALGERVRSGQTLPTFRLPIRINRLVRCLWITSSRRASSLRTDPETGW
ncbi:MAG: hypothetical protein RIB55_18650 [Nitratireductor sp.]|jgi:hypothetical protein